MNVTRRRFLQSASGSLGLTLLDRTPFHATQHEKLFEEIRATLLEMVNEERAVAKVPLVVMDDLATQVATRHAIDMAAGEYASHWGRDGFKPYHRYSFAGGTDATEENISAADRTWSMKQRDLKQDTAYLHVRLYQEQPPKDGHRKTILAPQHTHVGFGIAVEDLRLRLVELFVAKYVEVQPVRQTAKPGEQIRFAARIAKPNYVLNHVEVFYEPLPAAPELSWLRDSQSYALPLESRVLRPRVAPPLTYSDGDRGDVTVLPNGSFNVPIKLFKKTPGIYTIVAWIRNVRADKGFPATAVCIRAE